MLSVFKRVTEERNDVVANFFLESGGWDLETAVRLWSEQDESEVAMQQSLFKEEKVEEKEEEEETPTREVPTQEVPTREVRTAPTPPVPTPTKVRCCLCGVLTDPNESNKCLACLAPDIDLRSELMSKQDGVPTIIQCRECRKYQNHKKIYVHCDWESIELLQLCLKEIKGLRRNRSIRLVDTNFVYTEPHSKRVKLKLVVQKDISADIESSTSQYFRQTLMFEFKIRFNMCDKCARESANETQNWEAVTQIRQHHAHSSTKTLEWIENKILQSDAHVDAVGVRNTGTGLDIYWGKSRESKRFLDFVKKIVPCRVTSTKTLISHDVKSNTHRYQYTHRIDVVPLSKFDLVWIGSKKRSLYGDIPRGIAIVTSVQGSTVRLTHVTDDSYKSCDVPAITLWRNPLDPVVSLERDKTRIFLVLDVDKDSVLVSPEDSVDASQQFPCVASCFDVNASHIGRKVRGYFLKSRTDLSGLTDGDDALLPDVVLIEFE